MPSEAQLSIVRRWFQDIYERGDAAAMEALLAPDFIAHASDGNDTRGRKSFAEWLQWYRGAFSESKWEIHEAVGEADLIAVRYSGWSTYRGGLAGIPSKNQKVRQTGMAIFRLENSRIKEMWSELGDLNLLEQLGAIQLMRP